MIINLIYKYDLIFCRFGDLQVTNKELNTI